MAYHHNLAVRRKNRLIVLLTLDSPRTELYVDDDTGAIYLSNLSHAPVRL